MRVDALHAAFAKVSQVIRENAPGVNLNFLRVRYLIARALRC